ncbi:hypothetical protein COCOBI_13-3350 [Coccomyxa sp. Obi]|nr:hypothetical protein COCOBI_13-3350 [Coccomyxa sp. Obi]
MFEHLAPNSSQSVRALKRRRETCSDNQGLKPYKDSLADIYKRCQGRRPSTVNMDDYVFKGAGEDPEADLHAFISYDSLPSREAWSTLRREDYDRVKRVFARRGVSICKDTSDADMIKFKKALLLADMDLF